MSDVIKVAESYLGYTEKDLLGDIYTNKVGHKNFTRFAEYYKNLTGENLQGQPWCAMFVCSVFAEAYGREAARQMLINFFAWTPEGAENFKKSGRWKPAGQVPGFRDVVFFSNGGKRIDHVGVVVDVKSNGFYTIEGNTGDRVQKHYYGFNDKRIRGIGMTNVAESGWKQTPSGWRYFTNGNYLTDGFYYINGLLFHFDGSGYMSEGQFFVDGKRYYATKANKPIAGSVLYTKDGDDVKGVEAP